MYREGIFFLWRFFCVGIYDYFRKQKMQGKQEGVDFENVLSKKILSKV